MIIKENYPISKLSWLTTLPGDGYTELFYEPENIIELETICSECFSQKIDFNLIGHTSNTLFLPDYSCERIVSTRKLNHFEFQDNYIYCECGTSVRKLALAAIDKGIKGFEGLVDLPGTVGASIYGNAGCFGCHISTLLVKATVLCDDCKVIDVDPCWFDFSHRESVLKRGGRKAVIISVLLKKISGNTSELKLTAESNHEIRRSTQPEAKDSLGSIFAESGKITFLYRILSSITKAYGICLRCFGYNPSYINRKRRLLFFSLLNARDIEPYVRNWNWFQWLDADSFTLFWKYVRLHRLLFTESKFEIEIKSNN